MSVESTNICYKPNTLIIIGISGKGGQKIREIQEKSGAYIKVHYASLNYASHIFPQILILFLLF